MKKLISVVVPCYNEQEVLHMFYDEMSRVAGEMSAYDFEFISAKSWLHRTRE